MLRRTMRKEVNSSDSSQLVREPIQTRSRSRTTAPERTEVMGSVLGFQTPNNESVATQYKEVKKKIERPPEQTKRQEVPTQDAGNDAQKCPTCSSILHLVQGTEWQSSPVAQCLICPAKPYLCGTCLYAWQGPPGVLGHCANKRCAIVGTLLTCELITDPLSKVMGCPQFRACPKCYNLIMYSTGCKYMPCSQCLHRFCYICLRDSKVCRKDKDLYWSLTCSAPRSGRQRFMIT